MAVKVQVPKKASAVRFFLHPAGKALLAFSDPGRLDDFDIDLLTRKTRYSISTRRQLTEELKAIRARGVAYERAESVAGFGCVGAPIGDVGQAGEPIAAVSVCGPLDRMAFDHRLAGAVRTTALSIWRNFDDGFGLLPHVRPDRVCSLPAG